VSLRGGGPVSGLVLGDTLWATLWSNVVLRKDYDKGTDAQAPRAGGIFPWLAPTRTSSNDEAILAGNVHPLHVFWSMPRRIRLTAPDTEGQCDVCGISGPVVTSFRAVHHGGKYSGEWRHPLTPMRIDQNAGPLSIKGTALMGCYRDWWGLLFAEREKVGDEMVTRRHPSPAVLRHLERLHSEYRDVHEIRLRFCGYAMDNMKPLAWAEETMPARVAATSEDRKQQAEEVERLVRCADHVRSCLYSAVGGALADEKQKSPNGSTLLEAVNVRFWSATQPAFLDAVDRCLARLDDEDARKAARRVFLETLQNRAAAIFNESVLAVSPDDTQFERIGAAWGKLRGYTHGDKSRVWDILGILPPRRPERPEPPESPEFAEQAAPQEQGANR
jgi:CRISPR system Cascade subunit CasA